MKNLKIKRALVALFVCTAGEGFATSPAGVIAVGGGVLFTARAGQALLDQGDASNKSNDNGVNALNNNIQSGISGSSATQVKGKTQAPGM